VDHRGRQLEPHRHFETIEAHRDDQVGAILEGGMVVEESEYQRMRVGHDAPTSRRNQNRCRQYLGQW
jgi:hypothetical protein